MIDQAGRANGIQPGSTVVDKTVNDPVAGRDREGGRKRVDSVEKAGGGGSISQAEYKLVTDEAHHSHSEVAKTRFAKRLLDTYEVRPEATAKSTAG